MKKFYLLANLLGQKSLDTVKLLTPMEVLKFIEGSSIKEWAENLFIISELSYEYLATNILKPTFDLIGIGLKFTKDFAIMTIDNVQNFEMKKALEKFSEIQALSATYYNKTLKVVMTKK